MFFLTLDGNKINNTTSSAQAVSAPMFPPTSGHLMAERMKLGRQDQGDNDAGEASWSFALKVLQSIL